MAVVSLSRKNFFVGPLFAAKLFEAGVGAVTLRADALQGDAPVALAGSAAFAGSGAVPEKSLLPEVLRSGQIPPRQLWPFLGRYSDLKSVGAAYRGSRGESAEELEEFKVGLQERFLLVVAPNELKHTIEENDADRFQVAEMGEDIIIRKAPAGARTRNEARPHDVPLYHMFNANNEDLVLAEFGFLRGDVIVGTYFYMWPGNWTSENVGAVDIKLWVKRFPQWPGTIPVFPV